MKLNNTTKNIIIFLVFGISYYLLEILWLLSVKIQLCNYICLILELLNILQYALKYFGISYNNLYRGSEVNGFTNIDLNKPVKKDDILNGKFENEMSFVRAQLSDKCQVQRMFLKEYIEQQGEVNWKEM